MTAPMMNNTVFSRMLSGLGVSEEMTDILLGLMFTPELRKHILTWLVQNETRDEQKIFEAAYEPINRM